MARNRWQDADSVDPTHSPLPVVNFIDILLNLLIFFLMATTFHTEERDLKVKLPDGTQGDLIARTDDKLVINVREGGVIVINNQILTMEELDRRLATVGNHGPAIEIRGDANARHASIMGVMDLCKKNSVTNYSLTQHITQVVP